jgi:hypothetical protein
MGVELAWRLGVLLLAWLQLNCVPRPWLYASVQMLEDNQVLVQGMMANRYMGTFRDTILAWNKKLMAVADVVQVVGAF